MRKPSRRKPSIHSLLDELSQVTRAIEDAQTEVFAHIAREKTVVQRYFDGDVIVISFGRHWWVNEDGDLLGLVDESEILQLKALEKRGIFERKSINA